MLNKYAFPLTVLLSQCFGLSAMVMVSVWMIKDSGGIKWNGGGKQFNIHPFAMVFGFVFCYGEGLLVYRVFPNNPKKWIKLLHAVLLCGALVSSSVGIAAVFQLHNKEGTPNLKSIHSWFGLTTYIAFGLQFLCGLFSFLIPGMPESWKAAILPIHRILGGIILTLVAATCMMGILEIGAGNLGKVAGLMIAGFFSTVLFILQWTPWSRSHDIL